MRVGCCPRGKECHCVALDHRNSTIRLTGSGTKISPLSTLAESFVKEFLQRKPGRVHNHRPFGLESWAALAGWMLRGKGEHALCVSRSVLAIFAEVLPAYNLPQTKSKSGQRCAAETGLKLPFLAAKALLVSEGGL